MAGKLLAARWVAVWGIGFAMGLFAAQLSVAGTGRPGASPDPHGTSRPPASAARSSTEAAGLRGSADAGPDSRKGLTGAMRFDARYAFDVTVDAAGRASVVERLTATNRTTGPIDSVDLFVLPNFDAAGFREFELGSLRVDGHRVETRWTQDGANLHVDLPRRLQPGRTARLVLLFSLVPGAPTGGDLASALSRRGDFLQFLLWYPILSDGHGVSIDSDGAAATPASAVDYVIRTDRAATFAVPGTVTKRTDREVRGSLEHARDFAFAVGRGMRAASGVAASGASMSAYVPAIASASGTLALAIDAVDRYEAILRTPYPAAGLVVVVGSTNMESSGIVFVDLEHRQDPYTVAHEIAHEWFHWLVGNDQLREPWLDEAFATYLGDGLAPRHEDGYCSTLPVNEPVWRFENADPRVTWQRCDDYMQTVYYKGSWLLQAVRAAMGDEAFFASLHDYLATYRFGVATTADIVAIWRAHSDAVTSELIERWLDLRPDTAGARRPV